MPNYVLLCDKKIMKYTQEQMEVAIKEWQQSGLSKKAFCQQRGIPNPTFHYWYKRLASSSGFAEVKVAPSCPNPRGGYELVFPSGVRMVFQEAPSVTWLRELVY